MWTPLRAPVLFNSLSEWTNTTAREIETKICTLSMRCEQQCWLRCDAVAATEKEIATICYSFFSDLFFLFAARSHRAFDWCLSILLWGFPMAIRRNTSIAVEPVAFEFLLLFYEKRMYWVYYSGNLTKLFWKKDDATYRFIVYYFSIEWENIGMCVPGEYSRGWWVNRAECVLPFHYEPICEKYYFVL